MGNGVFSALDSFFCVLSAGFDGASCDVLLLEPELLPPVLDDDLPDDDDELLDDVLPEDEDLPLDDDEDDFLLEELPDEPLEEPLDALPDELLSEELDLDDDCVCGLGVG